MEGAVIELKISIGFKILMCKRPASDQLILLICYIFLVVPTKEESAVS